MGRRGRSQRFLAHWHDRSIELAAGDLLTRILIDDPAHPAPHAKCFRITSVNGTTRLLHPSEALELLVAAGHSDAEHVRRGTSVGRTFTH